MTTRNSPPRRDPSSTPDVFSHYVASVSRHARIDRDQEVALSRRIQNGDTAALEQMVVANLRLVLKIAYRYRSHGASFLDLVNEGNIGLSHAARKFDPVYGLRFSSCAVWWIKQAINLYLVQHGKGPISVPIRKVTLHNKIRRERDRIRTTLGRTPSVEETARSMGLTVQAVEEAITSVPEYADWDSFEDNHPGDADGSVELDVDRRLCSHLVRRVLAELPDHERLGMQLYFGLEGRGSNNFAQIGRVLKMSREGARQLVKRSLAKIRQFPEAQALRAYVY